MVRIRVKKSKAIASTQGNSDAKSFNGSNRHGSRADDANVASDNRLEVRRAWKAFLAVTMEFNLERIYEELAELRDIQIDNSSYRALLHLGAHEVQVEELYQKQDDVQNCFIDAVLRLDRGEPFDQSMIRDPYFYLDAIQSRMTDMCSVNPDLCASDISARASPDSAVFEAVSDDSTSLSGSHEESNSDGSDVNVAGQGDPEGSVSHDQLDVVVQAASDEVARQDGGKVSLADSSEQLDIVVTTEASNVQDEDVAACKTSTCQENTSAEQLVVVIDGAATYVDAASSCTGFDELIYVDGAAVGVATVEVDGVDTANGDMVWEDGDRQKTEAELVLELLKPCSEETLSDKDERPRVRDAVETDWARDVMTAIHSGAEMPAIPDIVNSTNKYSTPLFTVPFVDDSSQGSSASAGESESWATVTKKRAKPVKKVDDQLAFPDTSAEVQTGALCLDYLNTKSCKHGKACKFQHVYDPQRSVRPKDKQIQPTKANVAAVPASTPMENARFQGKDGHLRRKTEMCKNYQKGICGWGKDCNYAHSKEELRVAQQNIATIRRKPVSQTLAASVEERCTNAPTVSLVGTKQQMCKNYELGLCKRLPDDCKYAHHVRELDPALNHKEPCKKQQCPGRLRYEKRKTVMCYELQEKGWCRFGDECTLAHSLSELRPLPKHELCSKYGGGAMCLPSKECVYAHSRAELRPPSPQRKAADSGNVVVKQPAALTVQTSVVKAQPAAAKPQSAAAKPQSAAAKPQSASTQTGPHAEPCTRQHCPGRLAYETRWTKLCPSVETGVRCSEPNCNKAHRAEDLRPLPKYEMCSKYGGTKKCMPANQCPYAHTKDEQRPRPSSSAGSAKGGKAANEQKQSAAVSSMSFATAASSAAANDAHNLNEECVICYEQLRDPVTLVCGHDRFHLQCISKWVNEGRPNCPCCNHSVKLPDTFKAPAGLQPSDFPSLPL